MTTDTSERGLEQLIYKALTGAQSSKTIHERPTAYGAGWICGRPGDYYREYCVEKATGSHPFSRCLAGHFGRAFARVPCRASDRMG
jgi:hypothetical protein